MTDIERIAEAAARRVVRAELRPLWRAEFVALLRDMIAHGHVSARGMACDTIRDFEKMIERVATLDQPQTLPVEPEAERRCGWTEQFDTGAWDTGCGETFCIDEGTPAENSMRFCCYCGKPLDAIRATVAPDDEDDDQPQTPPEQRAGLEPLRLKYGGVVDVLVVPLTDAEAALAAKDEEIARLKGRVAVAEANANIMRDSLNFERDGERQRLAAAEAKGRREAFEEAARHLQDASDGWSSLYCADQCVAQKDRDGARVIALSDAAAWCRLKART